MKFTTYLMADISTRYVTREDGELMQEGLRVLGQIDEGRGALFGVPNNEEQIESYAEAGYSAAFIAIMRELALQKIPYVRFDCDGADLDGYPTFDW